MSQFFRTERLPLDSTLFCHHIFWMPLSGTLLSAQYRSGVTLIEMAGYRGHKYWQRKGLRLIWQVQCQSVIGWSMAKRFMKHRGVKENINADGDSWSETSYSGFHQQLILAITLSDRLNTPILRLATAYITAGHGLFRNHLVTWQL